MIALVREFWTNSYKSDKIAFYFELVSVIFTILGSLVLTFTSPGPLMHIVFPLYLIGSSTMLVAGVRRRLIWMCTLTSWFTAMNIIGNIRVFLL